MKLTDTLDEQAILEDLIERTKPLVPPECRHLNYLLLTPFRYSPYPHNSRFRRAGSTEGVFYAAEWYDTAVAESAFYRLLFFADSPQTPWPTNPGEYTAFSVNAATILASDLTQPPLDRERANWTHLTDYSACLGLVDAARAAGIEAIKYESVRDPKRRNNIALLTCRAFVDQDVVDRQTWHLHLSATGARATCEAPSEMLSFDRMAFAADPRLANMHWERPNKR